MPKTLIERLAENFNRRHRRSDPIAVVGRWYSTGEWTLHVFSDYDRRDMTGIFWVPETLVVADDPAGWDRLLTERGLHRKGNWEWDPSPHGGGSWDATCYRPAGTPPPRGRHEDYRPEPTR